MGKYIIEDTVFDVLEDKTVLEENYDIQDNILICDRTMRVVTRSSIYNYPDGFSLYLKFDDTGKQKLINLTLAIYKSQIEKQLLEFHECVDLKITRHHNNFLAVTDDTLNHVGSINFMSIIGESDVLKSEINYTKLEDMQMIDNQLVLVNCYENVDERYKMWLIALYDLNGRCKKTLLDKKVKSGESFRTQVVVNKKGMLVVWIDRVLRNGETKKLTDYDLKIEAPNMPAPEIQMSWLEKRRLKKEKEKERKMKAKAEKESKKQKEEIVEEEPKKTKSKNVKKQSKKPTSKSKDET